MKRKLMLLNLGLLAVLAAGGLEWNRRVEQGRSRYEILHRFGEPKDAPVLPAPQPPARVRQADYLPAVNRLLFYQDRNAVVEVETPPEQVVTRPALPVLSGVMNLGEGPIALMSATTKASPRPVAVGEKIGEYTFLGFSGDKLKLAWQGEEIELAQEQLLGEINSGGRSESRPAAASGDPSAAPRRGASSRPTARRPATKTPAPADNRKAIGGRYNIGVETRPGYFLADPADKSPDGTESEGYRKVVRKTPFGSQAWWERKDAQR
jgi:hypothetical protein